MARAIITVVSAVIIAAVVVVFAVTYSPVATKSQTDSQIQQPLTSSIGVDYEKQYRDNSLQVGKTIRNGSLAITLQNMGNYYYDGYGIYFRADLQIQNIGNETARVPQYYYITDGHGRQYQGDSHQFPDEKVLNLTDRVEPGETIEKFKLFRMIPSSAEPVKMVMVDPATPDDFVWLFQFTQ